MFEYLTKPSILLYSSYILYVLALFGFIYFCLDEKL